MKKSKIILKKLNLNITNMGRFEELHKNFIQETEQIIDKYLNEDYKVISSTFDYDKSLFYALLEKEC